MTNEQNVSPLKTEDDCHKILDKANKPATIK